MADTARPRAGEERDALAPKPGQRPVGADNAPGAAMPAGAGARPRPVRMSPAALQRLGGAAGNRAVANLMRPAPGGPAAAVDGAAHAEAPAAPVSAPAVVIQRYAGIKGGGGSFAPPAPPVPPNPKGDPKFLKVTGELKKATKQAKKHPPAKAEAKKAQAAAVPPASDKEAQAKAAQADKLAGAKKSGFDKAGFIAALTSALTKIKPKNLEESDDLASSGKADQVKNEVVGKVADGKKSAAQDLEAKAKEPPDPSVAKEKPVTPLKPEPEPKLATPKFEQAMPPKASPDQTNLSGAKNETDAKLKEADISESDLKKSNEPEMVKAVEAKKEGEEHSAKAPEEVRKAEAETIKSAESSVGSKGKGALAAMLAKKKGTVGQVQGAKSETKSKDEAERAKVTANINKIFDRTKTETETILKELDGKVTSAFESGEAEAKAAFTNTHQTAMRRYKAERYGGIGGGLLWAKDKLLGMPEEVNAFYEAAKAVYIAKMTKLAHSLADLVDGELTRAKQRVQAGRDEIKAYVKSLPKDLQKVGADAAKAVEEKFDSLESDVDNKGSALQEELASKYTEAMEKVNSEIEAMQAENKGLWDSIKNAIGGAIEAILKLKDLFMGMLAKAAGAFKKIISDPIAFIGNFLGAVKAGFMGFVAKIGDYLKKGLQGWLFGKLGEAGIEIPDKLDLPGIIKMVLSILGLTWASIRPKIVKRIGEKAMGVLETASDVFMILVKEGIPGLWKWIVDKVGDLKEMVIGQIRDFVIEKIVKAGITWVIGMLNPAGALIKIIQTLISVVQWIMEKGAALVELVGTIIDSVSDIANGGMGGVPAKIEGALAKAVPIVISFLASLLGLGGIGEKIKSILDAVRKPVGQAVDAVITGALKLGKKLIAGVKGLGKKAKDKIGGLLGPQKKTVGMKGSTHTLTLIPGPKPKLQLASTPGEVVAKAAAARAKLQGLPSPPAGQIKGLELIESSAQRLILLASRADAGTPGLEEEVRSQLANLSSLISNYGKSFKTDELEEVNPLNSAKMAEDQVELIGNRERMKAVDMARITLKIEEKLGKSWGKFVQSIGGRIYPYTEEALIKVFGEEKAHELITVKKKLTKNGTFYGNEGVLFIKPGRSLNDVAATIVHEATHMVQRDQKTAIEGFHKEFQSFSMQREFLKRLDFETRAAMPVKYKQLFEAEGDDQLAAYVKARYPKFAPIANLEQSGDVALIMKTVKKMFPD